MPARRKIVKFEPGEPFGRPQRLKAGSQSSESGLCSLPPGNGVHALFSIRAAEVEWDLSALPVAAQEPNDHVAVIWS